MAKYSDYQWILGKVTDVYFQQRRLRPEVEVIRVHIETPEGKPYTLFIGVLPHQAKRMIYLGIDPDNIERTLHIPIGKVFNFKLIPLIHNGRSLQTVQMEIDK